MRRSKNNKNRLKNRDKYVLTLSSYHYDYVGMLLIRDGQKQKLTFTEAELLKLFCINTNNILTREYLLETIWGENYDYFLGRSLDVYISKLRKHLKDDTSVKIVTIRSRGYKLEINNN
jgi:DNA-binding response OmpR family regulator